MGSLSIFGGAAASEQFFYNDTGMINKSDQPMDDIAGNGDPMKVKGQRADQGDEMFIEIKAPTFRGSDSSVPYSTVLPDYKDQAERAMNKNEIPKEHEERVRRYFDSLAGGGS